MGWDLGRNSAVRGVFMNDIHLHFKENDLYL